MHALRNRLSRPLLKGLLPALLPTFLAGCAVSTPPMRPPALPEAQLAERDVPGTLASAVPDRWWALFDDPALDALIAAALRQNPDLRIAAANLQQARALLGESRAAQLPDLTASAGYQSQRSRYLYGKADGSPAARTIDGEAWTTGLDASYEVDLFGAVRSGIAAALADRDRAAALLDAARVTVVAETARSYVSACTLGAQADVARDTLALQRRTLDLTRASLAGGRATPRDLAEAGVLVAQAEAQIPAIEAERRAALHALATLTGQSPGSPVQGAETCHTIPLAKTALPVGDGTALLARRPDVRAAERALAGDMARVGVARADLFPRITLLGSGGLSAPVLSNLGSATGTTYALGPFIRWNLPFNGAARARLHQARAQADGALAGFDKAVLTALNETAQALARLDGSTRRETALADAARLSREAAELTQVRYRAGSDGFLALLDAQRSLATAQGQAVQAATDRALAQIAVFKALGGGWQDAPQVGTGPARKAMPD